MPEHFSKQWYFSLVLHIYYQEWQVSEIKVDNDPKNIDKNLARKKLQAIK